MSFFSSIEMGLEVVSSRDTSIRYESEGYIHLKTDVNGLSEFMRNVESVSVACSMATLPILKLCKIGSGTTFLFRKLPAKFQPGSIAYAYIDEQVNSPEKSDVDLYIPEQLKLPLSDLMTNFSLC